MVALTDNFKMKISLERRHVTTQNTSMILINFPMWLSYFILTSKFPENRPKFGAMEFSVPDSPKTARIFAPRISIYLWQFQLQVYRSNFLNIL